MAGCTPAGGATAAAPSRDAPTAAPTAPVAAPVRILQLNLCNSGAAGCYTGRSIAAAGAVLRAETPDVVTLNEVCRDDVPALAAALGGGAAAAFQPARDGRTGQPYRCRNGQDYGVGLVARWPLRAAPAADGIYPAQDAADPEQRAWLCRDLVVPAAPSPLAVCTTHLAYSRRDVTAAQCRHLFGTVVAGLRARDGAGPVVVGGDLNLGAGDAELRACVPPGAAGADDGGPQHVVALGGLAVAGTRLVDLRGTTDHPGLLVTLAPR